MPTCPASTFRRASSAAATDPRDDGPHRQPASRNAARAAPPDRRSRCVAASGADKVVRPAGAIGIERHADPRANHRESGGKHDDCWMYHPNLGNLSTNFGEFRVFVKPTWRDGAALPPSGATLPPCPANRPSPRPGRASRTSPPAPTPATSAPCSPPTPSAPAASRPASRISRSISRRPRSTARRWSRCWNSRTPPISKASARACSTATWSTRPRAARRCTWRCAPRPMPACARRCRAASMKPPASPPPSATRCATSSAACTTASCAAPPARPSTPC